jgi:Terminase large subunit, T4likevirus-type, N-terminal
MVQGESGILAISPPWERPAYYSTRRALEWPNGAKALLFSGEDPESLRGPQCEALWADEIAAWQYPQETWDMALLGLRLGENPQACITSTPKPIRLVRDLVKDPDCVVTSGSTYANLSNLGPTYRTIIGRYEGTRLGRQELNAELLDEEGLAYKFNERVHVVPPIDIPGYWERFGSFDYGWTNPSALIYWTVDTEGNTVIYDLFYEPGWPSELVPQFRQRRAPGTVWADPSTWNKPSTTPKLGDPLSAADEFTQLGFPIAKANNDRRAGFLRVSELLRQDPGRPFPAWHPRAGELGSPRLFIVGSEATQPLRDQIVDAPLEDFEPGLNQGPHPGEAVAVKWESRQGHAHAALRYGAMTRPSPSEEPQKPLGPLSFIPNDVLEEVSRREFAEKHLAKRHGDDEWGYDPDSNDYSRYGYTT